ncbi:helix-turn-helix domain-containing protein [Streptomyces sp. NPDC002599]|uniref:helix-turn-helix domain-containing protein n=1 Tax=Streptomyces sp. NPDC002599 TaxID=3154421 RepID=UPI00331DA2E4
MRALVEQGRGRGIAVRSIRRRLDGVEGDLGQVQDLGVEGLPLGGRLSGGPGVGFFGDAKRECEHSAVIALLLHCGGGMAKFRMYPTCAQEQQMLLHCAHARYVWNLAVEQHAHWYRGRGAAPGFVKQCRQLTAAGRDNEWLGAGNADVQQQALKDFARVKNARFRSGFGEPTWRKKFVHEGFRVIGTDRVPEFEADGSLKLNARGKQIMGRSVVVHRLNRQWARVKVPGCGWVRFRLT